MTYLAVPKGTAEWLFPNFNVISALDGVLSDLAETKKTLRVGDFLEGPIRLSFHPQNDLITLVNNDYAIIAEESWGFIKLSGNLSLEAEPTISREVLERSIYVINQRLRALMIDGAYYHRAHANDTHTLLSGRGSEARKFSIGYVEQINRGNSEERRAVLCLGPERNWDALKSTTARERVKLPKLVAAAHDRQPHVNAPLQQLPAAFQELREAVASYAEQPAIGNGFHNVQIAAATTAVRERDSRQTVSYTFADWALPDSPLTDTQRRVLNSNMLDQHPLRIVGPAGSGKTLLMQLLALRQVRSATNAGKKVKLLYIVHSE